MPYKTNRDLPKSIRDVISSTHGKTIFRNVVNSQLERGKSDSVAFASAWAALQRAGWEKNEQGKWVEMKKQPTAGQVHVPGTDWKVNKAQYQGKDVELNKPFRTPGESKKFAVYVQDGDSIKIVRFGDPNMEIRRDDEKARASFRARHKCDQQTDKTSAAYWACRLWSDASVTDILGKRQLNDDAFTTDIEAQARSVDLGLEGEIHVHETADGMAMYMPGESHEEYLEQMEYLSQLIESDGEEEEDEEKEEEETNIKIIININKQEEEKRLIFGWASVIEENGSPIVDSQGDIISESELEKAFYEFVGASRKAGEMHVSKDAGELVEMMVFTKEKQEALGIDLGKVGAWVGFKLSPEVFAKVKSGEYKMMSIGGRGKRRKMDA